MSPASRIRLLLFLLGGALTLPAVIAGDSAPHYSWIQLVPDGSFGVRASVRSIVPSGTDCPSITIGRRTISLTATRRPRPANGFQAIRLCELVLDAESTSRFSRASLTGDPAGVIVPDLSRGVPLSGVIGFGCTGCRGKPPQQECTKRDWAFPWIVEHAATSTGELPPLVVHLGDVRYADQKTLPDFWSAGDVDGARAGWKEEFFDAAGPLLAKGIWIHIRGNHEACLLADRHEEWWLAKKAEKYWDRGSAWLYFFGHGETAGCESVFDSGDVIEPFAFEARPYHGEPGSGRWGEQAITIVALDTVRTGDDRDLRPLESREKYTEALDRIADEFLPRSTSPVWILSHIPIYSLNGGEFKSTVMLDALNESKLLPELSRVALVLSGHRHEALRVHPDVGNPAVQGPVQYSAGNAGVELSGSSGTQLACDLATFGWTPIGKAEPSSATWAVLRRPNHGYFRATFDPEGADAAMKFYSLKQDQGYDDPTLNCHSDRSGRFLCPYLPEGGEIRCP